MVYNKPAAHLQLQLQLYIHLYLQQKNQSINNMDKQLEQQTPQQILKHAKKHPHQVNVSTEAFTVLQRDYVVHNISLKGDPTNDYDISNYRRGLTFIQQIIDFKQQNLRVAKKGLRKFFDLLPQFLDEKQSHISTSRHYKNIKDRIIEPLKNDTQQYIMYSTEKANGENAQISWDEQGGFWVVGSKNKTLLLAELKDAKYITHKYEHVRTIAIAQLWFRYLQQNPQKVQALKQKLSKYVLIGQICDSVKSGHIVDYGTQIKIYFYALVSKTDRQFSCQPPSQFLAFAKQFQLEKYCVKFNVNSYKTFEVVKQQLKKQMFRIYEGDMETYGQGVVLYITTKINGQEHCQSICKIKTLQYRIYRKLRQKLKQYFQKYRKTYEKMLNKFIEQVKQLCKGFQTPKPEQYYYQIAKKAFEFCEDQEKAITKFFHNKYISFLKLIQDKNMDKQKFKKIIHQDLQNSEITKILQQNKQQKMQEKQQKLNVSDGNAKIQQNQNKQTQGEKQKKVLVLIPLTIPASGKSTFFKKFQENFKQYYIQILSSDTVRAEKMHQLMSKQKNLSKSSAFDKTRDSANKQYYKYLGQIFKRMENQKQAQNCILFLDKNHPQNALKKTIQEVTRSAEKCKNIKMRIGCVIPSCKKLIQQKSKYKYPFSNAYIASCMKRIIGRETHETLEGEEDHKINVLINFANMFRNFALSQYNLSKYFNFALRLPFTNEQPIPEQVNSLIIKIMLGSKPGSFDEHPALQDLIKAVKNWENYQQINIKDTFPQVKQDIDHIFENFHNIKVDISKIADPKQQAIKQQENKQ